MEKIKELFSMSGRCDAKHRLNTCQRAVPQEMLDAIEAGCSLEAIEHLVGNRFDVFKYNTQITIHGIFPETSTNRIGSYVNLVQNKNKSIGIRYSAVDCDKKQMLQDLFADCYAICRWHASINSSSFVVQRTKRVDTAEQFAEAEAEFTAHMRSVGQDLYFGGGSVYHASLFGIVYIVEEFQINAVYAENIPALFEAISGITWADAKKRKAEADAARAAYKAQRDREAAEHQKAVEHHTQLKLQAKDALLAQGLPDGVVRVEQYEPKRGDQIMLFHYEYDRENDRYSCTPSFWEVYWIGNGQYKIRKGDDKKSALSGKPRWVLPKQQQAKVSKPMQAKRADAPKIKIIVYSDKAVAVIGDTKDFKDKLKALGGRFNPKLSCGAGWIFSKKKQEQLEKAFGL